MIFTVVIVIMGGIVVAVAGWLGLSGRLTRQSWVGIRTRTTMQNDATWRAAHAAGGWWIVGGGAVMAAGGVAVLLTEPDDDTAAALILGALSIAVGAVIVGGVLGQRAARDTGQA